MRLKSHSLLMIDAYPEDV